MTKELLQEQLEILDRTNMHKNAAKERVIQSCRKRALRIHHYSVKL